MSVHKMSPRDIRRLGLEALAEALGPVGMARFLQQFETGAGDYTEERKAWLDDMDVEAIVEKIK
ncbi:MAG TPA: hypothetical protein ENF73_04520, partial [Proteobacteria bacterium]|nr:hypothetical protein [Pseudomonadota bacterium]